MANKIKESTSSSKKEYKKWRKSITKDDTSKSVSVEECENGFIIEICNEGRKNGEWHYDSKKYVSKENPLKDEDEYGMKDEMLDSLKDLGL